MLAQAFHFVTGGNGALAEKTLPLEPHGRSHI